MQCSKAYEMLALKEIFTVLPWKSFLPFRKSYFYCFCSFTLACTVQTNNDI